MEGWVALPLVEKESRATRGRVPRRRRASWAVETAMSESCSTVGFGDDAAIGHEEHALVAEAGVLDLHDHATGGGGGFRGDLDDLKERAEDAAGALVGAGDKAVGLVHGEHHGAVVIGVEHGLARLLSLHALDAAEQFVTLDEGGQVFALGRIDDADAFQGDVQLRGRLLDLGAVAQQDGRAQPQGMVLAGGLQDARFGSLREHHPFGVALQFFNNRGDKSHGAQGVRGAGRKLKV